MRAWEYAALRQDKDFVADPRSFPSSPSYNPSISLPNKYSLSFRYVCGTQEATWGSITPTGNKLWSVDGRNDAADSTILVLLKRLGQQGWEVIDIQDQKWMTPRGTSWHTRTFWLKRPTDESGGDFDLEEELGEIQRKMEESHE